MPPKTTSKDIDESLLQIFADKLKEQQEQQDSRHETITEALHTITEKLANISTLPPQPPDPPQPSSNQPESSNVSHPNPTAPVPPIPPHQPSPTHFPNYPHSPVSPFFTPNNPYIRRNFPYMPPPTTQPRPPKLQLTPFDGSEPLDWLFQAEQFFQLYQVPPDHRLHIISFYMNGEALSWFKWAFHNSTFTDWESFTRSLEARFGPSCYENHQAELFKLRQTGTVAEYQRQFETLCNRIWGLSPEVILNCFISGLLTEIRRELAVLRPSNIAEALGLAKLVESKIKDSKHPPHRPFRYPSANTQPTHFNNPRPNTLPNPPPTTQSNSPSFPIRRLTMAQMQERRAQGLCYNCDEKFHNGHKCQPRRFLLLLDDDFQQTDDTHTSSLETAEEDLTVTDDLIHFQLSEQALEGQTSPKTLRFQGSIAGHPIIILVDTGSSHNVIQPRLASYLQLEIDPTPMFPVMVGNGAHIYCTGLCSNTPVRMQNQLFHIPLYLLPIKGADIVLGIEWLRTLGPVTSDFAIPSMTFRVGNDTITLQGDNASPILPSSLHQLTRFLSTDSIASLHTILFLPILPTTHLPQQTTHEINPQIQTLLHKHETIFQTPHSLPLDRPHNHYIPLLPNSTPISIKPYRYPHSQKDTMTTMIHEMLKDGIITPSNSPFSSPVLLVKKKDGTWRFCVDYRALNAITIRDRFPIPTIDELLDELGGFTIFSKIYLRSGYHQIKVQEQDTHKTAFRTFDGHYEFLVMPFGLTNAPATFQAAMNDLLRPHLRRFVLVDDILIYSSNLHDHLVHLGIILDLLVTNQFYAKLSKCQFGVSTVGYLGHIISAGVVKPDPDKIQAMLEWPQPRSLTTLRGFLGLTGFYRKFVKHYATLAAPLTDLLKLQTFKWTTEAQVTFQELKTAMSTTPVLQLPNFSKAFVVETDASVVAIGAVLSQDRHPVAFFSKKMTLRMQHASAYVREMFAVTESVKKWRQYLIGRQFYIYTDQQSLKYLMTQGLHTPEQQKWATKLIGFDYEIKYRTGTSNRVVDALSRCHSEESTTCFSMSSSFPTILEQIRAYYSSSCGQQFIHKLVSEAAQSSKFHISQGLVFFQNRIFIPDTADLRVTLLKEFHEAPSAGHSGWKSTLARLTASCQWPGLAKDVKSFVQQCVVCQSNKPLTQKSQGLLQPLPIPEKVWDEISMDFITHLPSSQGHTVIWVVVDRLTKYAHFTALPTRFSAETLARRFLNDICKLHGVPKSIVSDRDPLFLSAFWKGLFKLLGTSLCYSTAYHPQSDGQTEVVNRGLQTYLRCFTGTQPNRWFSHLSLAEYWYNTNHHSTLQVTPFEALYGRPPPTLRDYLPGSTNDTPIRDILQSRTEMLVTLKQHLLHAQQRMKAQADSGRKDVTFEVGEWVLLRLQPYRQQTMARRRSQKLSRRFHGPFQVVRRVGQVAYELKLPPTARIHPVFHVSLLRRFYGAPPGQNEDTFLTGSLPETVVEPPFDPPIVPFMEPGVQPCGNEHGMRVEEEEKRSTGTTRLVGEENSIKEKLFVEAHNENMEKESMGNEMVKVGEKPGEGVLERESTMNMGNERFPTHLIRSPGANRGVQRGPLDWGVLSPLLDALHHSEPSLMQSGTRGVIEGITHSPLLTKSPPSTPPPLLAPHTIAASIPTSCHPHTFSTRLNSVPRGLAGDSSSHLEDKVSLQGLGNDRAEGTQRPIRIKHRPNWLSDFVVKK
ncbi:PREDICTED: uncharacterized protein LOC109352871 [Lupinus angustifolius]|uniref:uncharacterized protein LOC109352871 n=1 Tax=Lupinus angustifolius TaxID=3871 RepID=UPI00092E8E61|nr:PREDICTED: uncharacterized protein LOC109352871 [Lupinus angustifolius]